FLDSFQKGNYEVPVLSTVGFKMREVLPFSPTVDQLKAEINTSKTHTTVILAGHIRAAESLTADLNESGIKAVFCEDNPSVCSGGVYVTTGSLSSGFEIPSQQFTLVAYATGIDRKRRHKKRTAGDIGSLDELKPGDYVVHESHGIGIFDGITSMTSQGIVNDYIKIRYLGRDVLYVPVTSLNLVSRYIGPREDAAVKLHRLGSNDWKKTRARTKSAIKDIAKQLTALYAKRMQLKGYAFGPDTDLQLDFEHRFRYGETEDQLICSEEIKRDMQRPIPMDRLLCGDVGFGKTEVALRAAFKCIADGKQCAILVPTTILAWQHFNTASERFSYLPVNIEMLSRFRTPKQQESIKKKLKNGGIDLIIGTHKLFASDIKFNDLGLLIVDEEQRFGVSQKEKLKERFPVVDVLTLSATPIPRTLNMALSGLRDMSSIEDPPHDRLPVQTYITEHDVSVIMQAVTKEVRRNGQVFYLHNRTDTIVQTATRLQNLLPDIRIGIAHGKMDESELSVVWKRMLEHEIDLLVCTTIIETGVDVPNANTLIIEDADRMGLSQLHQIRGRVGRSSRRAYAYLLFRPDKVLSEVSQKRLRTIRDFTEFGSGFKIAMRDLEIRGAGNVLGSQQHGHMEAVGYDMYLKLLNRAIEEEKGIADISQDECAIEINVKANIPENYITSLPTRLSLYRRISTIKDEEDARDVIDELIDRFGSFNENVENLIDIALLKAKATSLKIVKISESNRSVVIQLSDSKPAFLPLLYASFKKGISFVKKDPPCISINISAYKNSLAAIKNIIEIIETCQDDTVSG
ncbi:MAG: transcription-repair coupling factor, partial [bacterium]|nr:transcription-repair coupling factor [bacterium]